jgi:hypothetical protein
VGCTKMYKNGSGQISENMYDYELKSPSNVPIFSRSAKRCVMMDPVGFEPTHLSIVVFMFVEYKIFTI